MALLSDFFKGFASGLTGIPLEHFQAKEAEPSAAQAPSIFNTTATPITAEEAITPVWNQLNPRGSPLETHISERKDIRQGLQEEFLGRVDRVLAGLEEAGYQPIIASGLRTPEEQQQKVKQGFSKTQFSRHLIGAAVDIVDRRWGWKGPAKDTNHAFWKKLGELADKEGLAWGGTAFKGFKDVAHVEMPGLGARDVKTYLENKRRGK